MGQNRSHNSLLSPFKNGILYKLCRAMNFTFKSKATSLTVAQFWGLGDIAPFLELKEFH